jgi:hypothetical protein
MPRKNPERPGCNPSNSPVAAVPRLREAPDEEEEDDEEGEKEHDDDEDGDDGYSE